MTAGSTLSRRRRDLRGADGREDEVRESLRAVIDPELGDTIVDLGMVRGVAVAGDDVAVDVALTIAACPLRTQIERDVRGPRAVPWTGCTPSRSGWPAWTPTSGPPSWRGPAGRPARTPPRPPCPPRTRVLAIASGKGGVGKSSVTVNLAVALARRGLTVGILDADIWGFSVPRLLGHGGRTSRPEQGKMVPLERPIGPGWCACSPWGSWPTRSRRSCGGASCSTGPCSSSCRTSHWGDLDYLLIDLPPGTGDIQMGLARLLPRTELLVVTTPPVAAQKVAARAADMARQGLPAGGGRDREHERLHLRARHHLRALRLGRRAAPGPWRSACRWSAPSRSTPTWPPAGDAGMPVAEGRRTSEPGRVRRASPASSPRRSRRMVETEGCTARLMARVEAAVARAEAGAG